MKAQADISVHAFPYKHNAPFCLNQACLTVSHCDSHETDDEAKKTATSCNLYSSAEPGIRFMLCLTGSHENYSAVMRIVQVQHQNTHFIQTTTKN